MAIYHFETQVIRRSKGRSSVACAAYRSGERLFDQRTGESHREGDASRVVYTEIVVPTGAPLWASKREELWNMVEAGERRIDSQVAREFELALPVELSLLQHLDLLRGWVHAELTPHGVIADIAVHDKRTPGKAPNPHSHIMGTMRSVRPDGWGVKWERAHNKNVLLARWRASWAEHTNRSLVRAGLKLKVTHLSHKDAGKEELPTIKEGAGARGMEARGEVSERAAENRRIRKHNQSVADQGDKLPKAGNDRVQAVAAPEPPGQRKDEGWSNEPTRFVSEDEAPAPAPNIPAPSAPPPATEEDVLWEFTLRQRARGR